MGLRRPCSGPKSRGVLQARRAGYRIKRFAEAETDASYSLSNIPVLVTFVIAFAAWWTAFIGQIIYESKYSQVRDAHGSAVGVSWFGEHVCILCA